LAVALAVALLLPSSAVSGKQKPYVLTAIANIGTVYWRYDFVHYRTPRWSLGIRIFYTATTEVSFRAGTLGLHRTLQPKQVAWFPFSNSRLQRLSAVQATEPGTLRAVVTARFSRHNFQSYLPPRLSVQLYPR
jgi:hypothetical protein